MSLNVSPSSFVDKLERQLAKCLPADKNIVRRKKNGDIIYETVRSSLLSPRERAGEGVQSSAQASTPTPAESTAPAPDTINLPNKLPQTPVNQENGNLFTDSQPPSPLPAVAAAATETTIGIALVAAGAAALHTHQSPPDTALTCHEAQNPGNQQPVDPLTDLLHRALAATKTRRGHPPALDRKSTRLNSS